MNAQELPGALLNTQSNPVKRPRAASAASGHRGEEGAERRVGAEETEPGGHRPGWGWPLPAASRSALLT